MLYEIREYNDQTITQHEIIDCDSSRQALQLADSIPVGQKAWTCESASGQPADDDFILTDPDDPHHCWAADRIQD